MVSPSQEGVCKTSPLTEFKVYQNLAFLDSSSLNYVL